MVSHLLVLLNRLKTEARRDWLTDSQAASLAEIERLWCFPERINLYGPPGAGKTFLAWTVTRVLDATYYASPHVYQELARVEAKPVVIDNAPDDSPTLRRLLAELQLNDARITLCITRQPNRLGLPAIALHTPTTQDVDYVYRNLSLLDYYTPNPIYADNLSLVIEQVL